MASQQETLTNNAVRTHSFLANMYNDSYFPDHVVDKGKKILITLCLQIEEQKPTDLNALYALTQAATDQFNDLQDEFDENESEIETVARECIGADFAFIAKAYGFEADSEELIATRDW